MKWECKACGSTFIFEEGQKVAVCDFCGMTNTLPFFESESKMQEFMQASEDRFNCKFDVAKEKYEQLIKKYPDDNEAYWGKLLCVYGIEYVDDFATEKKIPTCHRTVKESIFENADYKLILSRATEQERTIYEVEATEIDRIQSEIIAKAEKEQPYDIFICYKETESDGRKRTLDAQYAHKIYTYFTEKNYKVFFSRVTLRGMLGSEYEPIIYSALSTSKIMLHVTTSRDHTEAPWVRNEWSRYLEFMQDDVTKIILPCIAEMGPYELPNELSKFQTADMTDLDFYENLHRQIDSKFGRIDSESHIRISENGTTGDDNKAKEAQIAPLLKRVTIFLEDEEWDSANEYAEKALDIHPECGEAYLGKLLAELKIRSKEQLKRCDKPFDKSKTYQKIIRYADNALKQFVENCLDTVRDNCENARKESVYSQAFSLMRLSDEASLRRSAALFESITDWKDSANMAVSCNQKLAEAIRIREDAERKLREQEAEKKRIAERCEQIIRNLDSVISKEEILAQRKKFGAEVEDLTQKIQKLSDLLDIFPSLENKLNEIEKQLKNNDSERARLTAERSTLGFFAMKRKKEIDETVKRLLSEKESLETEEKALKEKQCGYVSAGSLQRELDKKNKELSEAEIKLQESNGLQTEEELIRELTSYPGGETLYREYEKGKTGRALENCRIGSYVKFGSYYQSSASAKDAIEWLVLTKEGTKTLLISRYGLDCRQAKTNYAIVPWESSNIRGWLNNEFFHTAFSDEEKKYVSTQTLPSDNNPTTRAYAGGATQDRVFLLSATEANRYFNGSADRKCKPTSYAKKQGAWTNSSGYSWWWLRTPGDSNSPFSDVSDVGAIHYTCNGDFCDDDVVRPAIWVDTYTANNTLTVNDGLFGVKPVSSYSGGVSPQPPHTGTYSQSLPTVTVGNTYTFGSYYQDTQYSKTPINWIVIAVDGKRALLLSKYGLDCRIAAMGSSAMRWENHSIRRWLNGDFYNTAFSSSEKSRIQTTKLSAGRNPMTNTYDWNDTYDKVFLLSANEVNSFLPKVSERKCKATAYAKMQGAWTNSNGYSWWWLRTPGDNKSPFSDVSDTGTVSYTCNGNFCDDDVIRPAIWITL